MKALRLWEYGGQLVLNDIPMPTIAGHEISVQIRSAAVNHLISSKSPERRDRYS